MNEITFDFACRDDCLDKIVPSDLRQLVAERDRLRARLAEIEGQEPVAWPLASPEDADKGWTLDYRFIEQVERIASQHTDYTTSMEATEQVLIAANEVLRASQPAEQQPVEGEEIMVNTPYDVFTLPLQPSGLSSGPRFVVHVPGPGQPAAPDVEALVEAAEAALGEIEVIMQEAYNSAYPVCCGRPGSECCGSPDPEWEEADQRMMDRLAPHQKALRDALAAHRKQEPSHDNQ
jgi:hypothetical protein